MFKVGAQETDRRSRPARKWRIAHKLTAASVLMIVLTLLAGGVGLWQVLTIGQAIGDAREKEQQRARSLELLAAGYRLVASLDRTLVTQDPALMSTDVPVSLGTLIFYMETLQQAGGEPKTADLLEEMQEAYAQLRQAVNDVDVLARQERWTEVEAALEQEIRPVNRQMNLLIRRLVRQADRDAQAVALRAQASVWQAAILLGLLTALTTVIALGWRQFVFRDLSLSITKLRQGVTRISSGDLEHQIDVRTGDEIEELGAEFNKMADQLASVIGTLEQRVSERTRGLQAAAEVARATTMVLDPDQLLRQVVDLARERFDLYYVGLFLLDDERRFAVLRAGTGQPGQLMMEQGHRLRIGGESMIGQCVARSEARIALDVGEEPSRFDNPLLPETHSEMALPLRSRGRVIGAMTVQSAEEAAFDEADIAVMQTMADQVAVAIDNAQLFAETQAVLEKMEATHRRYLGQAWAEYALTRAISGYAQTDAGTVPLGDQLLPKVLRAMAEQRPVIWSGDGDEGQAEGSSPTLALPITLRGQPIGVMGFTRGEGERQWSEDDVALAEALTEQFALAADNLRLLDETQRRAAHMEALAEIGRATGSVLNLGDVLRLILAQLERVVPYDTVALWLREGNTMRIHAARGFETPEAFIGFAAPIQEDKLFSELVHNRQPLIIADAQHDERFRGFADTEWVRSWLGVPLLSKGEVVGLLTIDKREPNFYTAEAARLTFAFGQQVALAIENARMFEETQRRAERERMIGEVTGRMRASLDLESVLKTAADEIYQALGLDEIVIRLATEETRDGATPKSLAADRVGTRPLGEEVV